MSNSIYMYLDEAGNFDFSPKGSKYFIMTCVVMKRPFNHIASLASVKYDCMENGINEEKCKHSHKLHATEDTQATRDKVFEIISEHLEGITIFSVIIRKNKANPTIRDQATLYSYVFTWLMKYAVNHINFRNSDSLIVVTDTIPVKKKLADVRAALKKEMGLLSARFKIPYRLYHHRSESDLNLQLADYCCWAIQRKWERNDLRSYSIIETAIAGEGDLFKNGTYEYYYYEE